MTESTDNGHQGPKKDLLKKGLILGGAIVLGLFAAAVWLRKPVPENAAETVPTEVLESSQPTIQTQPQTEPVPTEPLIDPSAWNLLLVNPWNSIPEDFSVELAPLEHGHAIDCRAQPDLQTMLDDLRAEGLSPVICSSYRTNEKQQTLFRNKVSQYLSRGYSQEDAEREAGKQVAVPGTSEHQLGLAVDLVDASYQVLDEGQEDTAVQQWLMANSWQYGFILRYPSGKSDITGIDYEPWHYRYVGKEAARQIYEQGICLEEYLLVGTGKEVPATGLG